MISRNRTVVIGTPCQRYRREYGKKSLIIERLNQIQEERQRLEREAEELRDNRAELITRLDDLRSADDVHEAHETIQKGQQNLEPLAEEYATNRVAEYFLHELYDRFIDRTTGPLLDDATRYSDGSPTVPTRVSRHKTSSRNSISLRFSPKSANSHPTN